MEERPIPQALFRRPAVQPLEKLPTAGTSSSAALVSSSNGAGGGANRSGSPAPTPTVAGAGTPSVGPAGAASTVDSVRERMARNVMQALSVVDWIRQQWLLWCSVLTILLAKCLPVPALFTSIWTTRTLVFISLVLTGAAFPEMTRSMVPRYAAPVTMVLGITLLVSPAMGVVAYLVLRRYSTLCTGYLCVGLLCTSCLPASTVLAVFSARDSLGNESLVKYLTMVGVVVGVVVSPPLMYWLLYQLDPAQLPTLTDMLLFPLASLTPLVVGVVAQRLFACATRRRHDANEDTTCSPVSVAPPTCAELLESNMLRWRSRCSQMNCVAMLVLNYIMFSALFTQWSGSETAMTWSNVLLLLAVEVCLHLALLCASWVMSASVAECPDDRISIFFASHIKSEVLAIPFLLYMFRDSKTAAVALIPAVLYHFIQTITSALLNGPLRRWRNSVNCRPGTTLLPLRLSKNSRSGGSGGGE